MEQIYLDHAATTPTHKQVANAMIPYMTEIFGNPSSVHHYGRKSRHVLDEARLAIAKSIHANENEIIFTSGGTEADNLAIIGGALANFHKGNHIITTAIEHHAVLHACQHLESIGFQVTYLPVNEDGLVSLDDLRHAITEETILISIMFGNNEVGTIQPIKAITNLLSEIEKDIIFHTDAVQAYGALNVNVQELKVDLLSVSGHKINGPKGIGFLYVKEGTKLSPVLYGGEQERKRRAGTENVPGIVGLKEATDLAIANMDKRKEEYIKYKEKIREILSAEEIGFHVNAENAETLPHVLNISFPGTNVESMLVNLDLAGIAASSGSACTAGSIDPSHVLVAMFGKNSERIQSSIRFSFGLGNTLEQIERAAQETARIVKRLTK